MSTTTNMGSARVVREASRWIAACLVAITFSGCSTTRTYPNDLPKNLNVTTQLDPVAWRMGVQLDVHRIGKRCELDHQGRVRLDQATVAVGIPVGETIYLDFLFASAELLSSSVSTVRWNTLLTPRAGYDYHAEVKYAKGIYGVVIRETRKGGSDGRVIERVPLSGCNPRA